MKYVNLKNYLGMSLFNIATLERIFIILGGLREGSFSIAELRFTDGSDIVAFYYPSDFSTKKAYKFVNKLAAKLVVLSIKDLVNLGNI